MLILLALSACVNATGAIADEIDGLYEVRVRVDDESQAARKKAIRTAMRQMLIKVTGGVNTPAAGQLGNLASKPTGFVQQYRYERGSDSENSEELLFLRVSFDPKAVNSQLRIAKMPIWGSIRPKVLVWMAIEDRIERQILGRDGNPELTQLVQDLADKRGVPLLLPLMDASDYEKIQFTDVWGGFKDKILSASQRYKADAILIGRVYRDEPDGWQARWTILHRDQSLYWNTSGYELAEIFSVGVDGTVDTLASHFAPETQAESQGAPIVLAVKGVADLSQYAELVRYLAKLEPVESAEPVGISADTLEVRLALRGSFEALRQLLLLGKKLEVYKPEFSGDTSNAIETLPAPGGPRLHYKIKQ